MKKLGFGLMRLPLKDKEDASAIDQEQLNQMVDLFLEKGFTYFDTAYPYHKRMSEHAVKKALSDRHPRESFLLADKMPVSVSYTHLDVYKRQHRRSRRRPCAGHYPGCRRGEHSAFFD